MQTISHQLRILAGGEAARKRGIVSYLANIIYITCVLPSIIVQYAFNTDFHFDMGMGKGRKL